MAAYRVISTVLTVCAIAGCRDATDGYGDLPVTPTGDSRWVVETLLTARAANEMDLIPVAAAAIASDSLIVSDAATMSLRACGLRPMRCGAPIGDRWRPALPSALMPFTDGQVLVATPTSLHLLARDRRTVALLFDSAAVGSFVGVGGTIVSAPWVGSPTGPTVVPFAGGAGTFTLRNPTGVVEGTRVWPLADTVWNYSVGARSRVMVAGLIGSELLVVRGNDGEVWRVRWPMPNDVGLPSWQVPTSFRARPLQEIFDRKSRQVHLVIQPRVKAATVVGENVLGVLRVTGYQWRSWSPLERRSRDWEPQLSIDAYTVDGQLIDTRALAESDWMGIGPIPGTACVMLWRPPVGAEVESDGVEHPAVLKACLVANQNSSAG